MATVYDEQEVKVCSWFILQLFRLLIFKDLESVLRCNCVKCWHKRSWNSSFSAVWAQSVLQLRNHHILCPVIEINHTVYLRTADGDVCLTLILIWDRCVFGQDQVWDATVFCNYTDLITEEVWIGVIFRDSKLFIVWIEGLRKDESKESIHYFYLVDNL